jgi:hypothetical protein
MSVEAAVGFVVYVLLGNAIHRNLAFVKQELAVLEARVAAYESGADLNRGLLMSSGRFAAARSSSTARSKVRP